MTVTLCDICGTKVDDYYAIDRYSYRYGGRKQLAVCSECRKNIKQYCKAWKSDDVYLLGEEIKRLARRMEEIKEKKEL